MNTTLLHLLPSSFPHLFNFHLKRQRKQRQPTRKIWEIIKNNSMTTSSVFSLALVIFLVFFGTQLGFCSSHGPYHSNFITWEDLKVEQHQGRLNLNNDYNSSRVIVVSKDGTGDSVTVQGAIDMVNDYNTKRVKILILSGVYRERVFVPRTKPYISLIGKQRSRTVISWHAKASDKNPNGQDIGTYDTATVAVESDYFCATEITFENTVVAAPGKEGNQAVALRVSGDKSMFFRIRVLGSQDTLLDDRGTHYYYQCYIQGAVDFIFGEARSLYQDCTIHSTAEQFGAIAASHRNFENEQAGFSFVNCRVKGTGSIYLGRAWGRYSRAIYSYCDLDGIINPMGWSDWGDPSRRRTVQFGEYKCRGKGANPSGRVPWFKTYSYEQARPFLNRTYLDGDKWLKL
ncbi:pectinesterase QRT1 [Macadamia integrifolia]|uniref:pectinesterase QRT1 n=1 Tax=Macadamia integrifolia TaxID=60698 RepID=UPI001C52E980|nr:pectinesterase QRT1 [Macadamia integrifolia]